MGKGDKKTKRGKIFKNSYGKLRMKKKTANRKLNAKSLDSQDEIHVQTIIYKKTGEKLISIRQKDTFELVDPIKFYGDYSVTSHMIKSGIPKDEMNGQKKPSKESREVFIEGMKLWNNKLAEIRRIKIPKNLIDLLSTTKKSEQVKLLKGVVLTSDLLAALIFEACEKHGFKLSQYKTEIPQDQFDTKKMPLAYEVKDNGDVKTFGKTELSDGQLKQAINQRKMTISKFLEKEGVFHCFFTNQNSLNGVETWLGKKQPHFHYISNSFGLEKGKILKELSSKKYKLNSLPHLKITDYGKQPE